MEYKPPLLPPRNRSDWPKWLAELARAGARMGFCGRICTDCAFKHPQPITTDYTNAAEDAVHQLAWEGNFHCHTADHKDAGTKCVGFSYAKQYIKHHETDSTGNARRSDR